MAASSAVPGLFTPITLRSYAGRCGFEPPAWLEEAGTARTESLRRLRNAQIVQGYLRGNRQYIHLVDGGIADNLGLRVPLDNVILVGGLRQRVDQLGGARPAHIMVVVANVEVNREPTFSLTAAAPSLGRMLSAVSGVQISSYNFETLDLMRQSLQNWADESLPDAHGRRTQTYLPVVAFESIEDPKERAYFNALPTSFHLDDEAVDRLIAVGRGLFRESPEFQRFIATLQADVSRAPFEDMMRTTGGTAARRP